MTPYMCFALFATWTEEERQAALPGEYVMMTTDGERDAWTVYATAAISLTGAMARITDVELGAALQQFRIQFENGVYNEADWNAEAAAMLPKITRRSCPTACDCGHLPAFSSN